VPITCPSTPEELEARLSEPTPEVIEALGRLDGDLLLLGVAGKMGPSLARMAKRAFQAAGSHCKVIGVSRFTNPVHRQALERDGIETISCDLLDEEALAALPDAPNVLFLAGMKFGSTGQEALTWAMNTYLPALVCRRYPKSRIVAFSTGNIYGLTPAPSRGSVETDSPAPVGEYAMSCLGRERMFEYFSRKLSQPQVLLRLNYACDLRYGVLVDLAQRVWNNQPVDLAMGYFNTIWQGDANAMTLRALGHGATPSLILNLTGPETLPVRSVCRKLGELMNREPQFNGSESASALLSDATRAFKLFGRPQVSSDTLIQWVAAWVSRGGPLLNKPTHFEARDGKF
jgi:nucleoside-diphosphate-sugar epimerase